MRVELIRDARITHKAGEVVEVSPSEGEFLLNVGSAKRAEVEAVTDTEPKVETKRKTIKKK